MTHRDLITAYLDASTPGRIDFEKVRSLLTDDFTHLDPLGGASSADDFVGKLRMYSQQGGEMEMPQTIHEIAVDGDRVAVLSDLHLGPATVTYAHWYWVRDGKVAKAQVVYDPRACLEMAGGG